MNIGDHISRWCLLQWLDHWKKTKGVDPCLKPILVRKLGIPFHNGHNPQYIHTVLAWSLYSCWCIFTSEGSQKCKTPGVRRNAYWWLGPAALLMRLGEKVYLGQWASRRPMGFCITWISIPLSNITHRRFLLQKSHLPLHCIAQRKGSCPAFREYTLNNFSDTPFMMLLSVAPWIRTTNVKTTLL